MSTLLSVSGLSNEIAAFYAVDIEASSVYVGAFLFIVGITAIFLPAYLSKYERKRFFIIALAVTVISTLTQSFVNDFMISFLLRIIPAFFYSTASVLHLHILEKLIPIM
ncbi:MAG: MFS transporter [archaeon]|nr:MFS transporter [archaeon]